MPPPHLSVRLSRSLSPSVSLSLSLPHDSAASARALAVSGDSAEVAAAGECDVVINERSTVLIYRRCS